MNEHTILWQLGNMTFHGKTLVMTWIVMLLVIIFCYAGVRRLTSGKPGKMQNLLEWIVDFVNGIFGESVGPDKLQGLKTYMFTLITFIFFSNMFGLLPNLTFNLFEHFHVETAQLNKIFEGSNFMSPTADVNTTFALSIMSIILVLSMGIKYKGGGYFKHFIEPNPAFAIIHIIDFLSKPLTLGMRLFGNIFAGEVLIKVMMMIPGYFLFSAILPDTLWLAFSIFIGVIQSYVFTVLTLAYLAQAVTHEH